MTEFRDLYDGQYRVYADGTVYKNRYGEYDQVFPSITKRENKLKTNVTYVMTLTLLNGNIKTKTTTLGRLVNMAFDPIENESKYITRFVDGNPFNHHVDNLVWQKKQDSIEEHKMYRINPESAPCPHCDTMVSKPQQICQGCLKALYVVTKQHIQHGKTKRLRNMSEIIMSDEDFAAYLHPNTFMLCMEILKTSNTFDNILKYNVINSAYNDYLEGNTHESKHDRLIKEHVYHKHHLTLLFNENIISFKTMIEQGLFKQSLTRVELAKKLSTSVKRLNNWLNGDTRITFTKLEMMGDILDIDIQCVIDRYSHGEQTVLVEGRRHINYSKESKQAIYERLRYKTEYDVIKEAIRQELIKDDDLKLAKVIINEDMRVSEKHDSLNMSYIKFQKEAKRLRDDIFFIMFKHSPIMVRRFKFDLFSKNIITYKRSLFELTIEDVAKALDTHAVRYRALERGEQAFNKGAKAKLAALLMLKTHEIDACYQDLNHDE